jgi:four helix bundle protein
MGGEGFEDLAVYQRVAALSDQIRDVVGRWDALDVWTLGVQLVRAIDSVGANLAEGCGRRSDADRRRFVYVARGSAYEVEHWLMRAQARSLALPENALVRAREIGRMLNGMARARTLTGY